MEGTDLSPTELARRTLLKVALADLRTVAGARIACNKKGAAEAIAHVECVLASAIEGLSLADACALHDDTCHDEGEKIVEVTMDDILELADLAEQTRKGNLQMLAMLRENRERMLACAVDREATERWIESTTARLVESDQFDARQLEQYREILESRAEWRWKWAGGAGHGC